MIISVKLIEKEIETFTDFNLVNSLLLYLLIILQYIYVYN